MLPRKKVERLPWTPAEDALVREAMARPRHRMAYQALAVRLGRTHGAIRTRAFNLRRRDRRE